MAREETKAEQLTMDIEGASCNDSKKQTEKLRKAEERKLRKQAQARIQAVIGDTTPAIDRFCTMFGIGTLLRNSGIVRSKNQGPLSAFFMFVYLFSQMFRDQSIYRQEKNGTLPEGISTSSVSRFLNNAKYRWESFLYALAGKAYEFIRKLTSDEHKRVFTVDDTDYDRVLRKRNSDLKAGYGKHNKKQRKVRKHRGSRTELAARKYDHARKVFSTGFRMLTVGVTDSMTFIPVCFRLLSSQDKSKVVGDADTKDLKKNTVAYQRRIEAQSPTIDVLVKMMCRVVKLIKDVHYICADRWFSDPKTLYTIKSKTGLHVITVLKHNRTKYLFEGKSKTISEIYKSVRKRPGVSRYLAIANITIPTTKTNGIPEPFEVRVVFVRNKANRKEWIAILCTDTTLSAEDIIQYYALRWKTEVFFWTCKMYLRLTDECHALSYDAITAHATIVCVRYMLLAIEQRMAEDQRTLGELLCLITEEIKEQDISAILAMFAESFFDAVIGTFCPSEEQMNAFMDRLLSNIPPELFKYLKNINLTASEDDEESAA